MKFSHAFNIDYAFYLKNIDTLDFSGRSFKGHAIFDSSGVSAKEAFHSIDSKGMNVPCREPELLEKLLNCKASVNLHIKMWAEGRAEGTLPGIEFVTDYKKTFDLPDWCIKAVEMQKIKLLLSRTNNPLLIELLNDQKQLVQKNFSITDHFHV